jgi:ornithine cyclodeaminase/alanine dehydrogenase-like protein (mu-crystallin family)
MTIYENDPILYLSRKDVETACEKLDSVAVIREVFRLHGSGQTHLPDEAYLGWTNARGESVRNLNMPGHIGGSWHIAGTKIINGNIHNPTRGLPRASGITLLYDDISARVLCIMESAYISSLRTASVTALAADLLHGPEIERVAILGAGALARAHIELLARQLPHLRTVLLFELAPERATALQHDVTPLLQARNIELQVTTTAEEAIRAAQLIVPATTTTEGYIHFDWLQRGSVLVNISLDDPLPEVVYEADQVIVDDWNLVKSDSRRLLGRMYRQGQISGPDDSPQTNTSPCRRIDAQLGDIVAGTKPGRRHTDNIILVNPFGLAIEDVALAAHVYQAARDLGLGTLLAR